MNILLSQVYHSRHPASALQRQFSQPYLLPKAFGSRRLRMKVRHNVRLGVA